MPLWRVYRPARALPGADPSSGSPALDLALLEAPSADRALVRWAVDSGRTLPRVRKGSASIVGFGLVRAEMVKKPVPTGKLPALDAMRAVLLQRGHGEAPSLTADAVEARYRANVLGEFVPHTAAWRSALGVATRDESPVRGVAAPAVRADVEGNDRGADDRVRG